MLRAQAVGFGDHDARVADVFPCTHWGAERLPQFSRRSRHRWANCQGPPSPTPSPSWLRGGLEIDCGAVSVARRFLSRKGLLTLGTTINGSWGGHVQSDMFINPALGSSLLTDSGVARPDLGTGLQDLSLADADISAADLSPAPADLSQADPGGSPAPTEACGCA